MRKPIKIFYSEMSGRFYASSRYKEVRVSPERVVFEITGEKFDVTDDIGYAVENFDVKFTRVTTPPATLCTPEEQQ